MRTGFCLIVVWLLTGCKSSATSESPNLPSNDNSANYAYAENVSFAQVVSLEYTDADTQLSYGDKPLQFGKLWLPDAASPPLIIFVHGGCWLNQFDLQYSYPMASALKQQGYAVWSFEYRRVGDPGGGWPGSLNDVVQAIEFIQSQNRYNFDWQQVSLLGHSAGGHLALLASKQLSVPVNRTIGLAPIVDITKYAQGQGSCQNAAISFMGGTPEQKPTAFAQANPVNYAYDENTVLLSGALDNIVPLTENPLPATQFQVIQGAGHFDWVHPGTPAFDLLMNYLEYE